MTRGISVVTGKQKVALYVKNGEWTHAARQLKNGKWTSKLGPLEDIEHDTPDGVECPTYGEFTVIMEKEENE